MRRRLTYYRYGNEFIMALNSTLCLISAFIVMKFFIAFSRYLMMKYFNGDVLLVNFDVICVSGPYSKIWSKQSVVLIYAIGVIVSTLFIFASLYAFNRFKYMRGLTKLWLLWLYVSAIVLTIGTIVKDIMLKRDFIHALSWLYVPRTIQFFIVGLGVAGLLVIGYFFYRRFLRLSISLDLVKTRRMKMEVYTVLAVIPSIAGAYVLLFMHFYDIRLYEIVEAFILIITVFVPYVRVYRDNKPINLLKNESTNVFNNKALIFASVGVVLFYFFNFVIL